jgi:hypothetical protein
MKTRHLQWPATVAAVVLGFLAISSATAAAGVGGHVVRGVVNRDPFCDAQTAITVALAPTERSMLVDPSGAFAFDDVADGDYVVSAEGECQPSEYSIDTVFVRGTDAYTELYPSNCPKGVVTSVSDGMLHIVGRCYFIHSGASANVYVDQELVGTVRGDTPGQYETTIDVTNLAPGRHYIQIAVPGPILGLEVGSGVFEIAQQPCPGDCNRDGRVAVSELITGVRLALGEAAVACGAFDGDGSGTVEVDELVDATDALLNGCP